MTWQSLLLNVVRPLQADLALLISPEEAAQPGVLQQAATHIWTEREHDDWGELVTELLGTGKWRSYVTLVDNLWGGVRVCTSPSCALVKGSGALIMALRMVLLRQLDALSKPSYRRLVLTRSDYMHACPPPGLHRQPLPGQVYVPVSHEEGVTDRHSMFAFSDRRAVLAVLPWLVQHSRTPGLNLSTPEEALAAYFRAARLSVVSLPRTMFTVATPADRTRWHRALPGLGVCVAARRNRSQAALRLKYWQEFSMVVTQDMCHRPGDPPPETRGARLPTGRATTGSAHLVCAVRLPYDGSATAKWLTIECVSVSTV